MSVLTTLYGIKNCDTMKKARQLLDTQNLPYEFHDYKARGIERAKLESWCKLVGWELLLNKAGTTFRKLPEAKRANLDERTAISLMFEQPSMIKRPVLERGKQLVIGFSADRYAKFLA